MFDVSADVIRQLRQDDRRPRPQIQLQMKKVLLTFLAIGFLIFLPFASRRLNPSIA
jgi:hypothetical protein